MDQTVPNPDKSLPALKLVVCVFLPFAAGYFLSYLFRVVNAVIASDLAADLSLTAGALGLLTSAYFLTFAAFQLPLGVLLDRYGPRRVVGVLMIVAGAGSLLFALGPTLTELTVGRALIGIGVSGCLMGSFKAFVQWFEPHRLPLVNGCLLAFGGMGAMAATSPVEYALSWVDWRTVFVGFSVACVASSALIWSVVPDHREAGRKETIRQQIAGLRSVFASAWFWRVAPLAAVLMGGTMAVQGLWAGPWMRDVAGFDRSGSATGLLLIAFAMTVGFPLWGLITMHMSRRGVNPAYVVALGAAVTQVLLLLLALQVATGIMIVWMLFAFSGSCGALMFAVITRSFSPDLAGRVNAGLNLLVFVGAFAIQWGLGIVIQFWESGAAGGYDPHGYQVAFATLGALQLAAYLWFLSGLFAKRA
ncbi:MAG: MFS transporter [Aquisalimonadaceae bacterium]